MTRNPVAYVVTAHDVSKKYEMKQNSHQKLQVSLLVVWKSGGTQAQHSCNQIKLQTVCRVDNFVRHPLE
jgi:hypothetical protein